MILFQTLQEFQTLGAFICWMQQNIIKKPAIKWAFLLYEGLK